MYESIYLGESDVSAKASGSHSTASSVSGGRQIQDDSGHFSVPIEVSYKLGFGSVTFCLDGSSRD